MQLNGQHDCDMKEIYNNIQNCLMIKDPMWGIGILSFPNKTYEVHYWCVFDVLVAIPMVTNSNSRAP